MIVPNSRSDSARLSNNFSNVVLLFFRTMHVISTKFVTIIISPTAINDMSLASVSSISIVVSVVALYNTAFSPCNGLKILLYS